MMEFNSEFFSLKGKIALVTGATYGIGFALASAFAKAGQRLFMMTAMKKPWSVAKKLMRRLVSKRMVMFAM